MPYKDLASRMQDPVFAEKYRARRRASVRKAHRKSYPMLRARVEALKARPCQDCGREFPPECMDFDHRLGEKKFAEVGYMLRYSWERILAEVAKCDLVCACCHRIRTRHRGKR